MKVSIQRISSEVGLGTRMQRIVITQPLSGGGGMVDGWDWGEGGDDGVGSVSCSWRREGKGMEE